MELKRIDDIFVIFNDQKFRKDKRTGYYWSVKVPRKSLHLTIFEFHGNVRPNGYELHHIDFNKENNDILNIGCLKAKDHNKIHKEQMRKAGAFGKNWNRAALDKAREIKAEWIKTEGYKKYLKDTFFERSEKSKAGWEKIKKEMPMIEHVCEVCGDSFLKYLKHDKSKRNICSNRCRAQDRRDSGVDNVEKECIVCCNKFISNKNQKIKTCSTHCRAILGYSNRK